MTKTVLLWCMKRGGALAGSWKSELCSVTGGSTRSSVCTHCTHAIGLRVYKLQ